MTVTKFGVHILLVFAVYFTSCSTSSSVITPVRKLLIDTDAGADDAVAILMAVGAEKLDNGPKIIGITCVNGNTNVNQVARNVLKTLDVANRLDIPVYEGTEYSLILPAKEDHFFGKDGFGDFYYPNPPSADLIQPKHAVMAMIELVMEHPGEVTLLTLGPLTNVALAIRMYPSFLDDLQQLIIMGGTTDGFGYSRPGVEFNFFADPAANHVVFSSMTSNPGILVPIDSVMTCRVSKEFWNSMRKSNNTKVWLLASADSVAGESEHLCWDSPDGIAAAVALTSGSIVTKSGNFHTQAVYDGSQTSGMIVVDFMNITGNAANVNIIQDIDFNAFKQFIIRYLTY